MLSSLSTILTEIKSQVKTSLSEAKSMKSAATTVATKANEKRGPQEKRIMGNFHGEDSEDCSGQCLSGSMTLPPSISTLYLLFAMILFVWKIKALIIHLI